MVDFKVVKEIVDTLTERFDPENQWMGNNLIEFCISINNFEEKWSFFFAGKSIFDESFTSDITEESKQKILVLLESNIIEYLEDIIKIAAVPAVQMREKVKWSRILIP